MSKPITYKAKPCPCCNSSDVTYYDYDPYDGYHGDCTTHVIKCCSCGIKVEKTTMLEAFSIWNNRVIVDSLFDVAEHIKGVIGERK